MNWKYLLYQFHSIKIQQSLLKRRIPWANALIVVYIGLLIFQGQKNVQKQLNISGEFNNESQEKLFRWIEENTRKSKLRKI